MEEYAGAGEALADAASEHERLTNRVNHDGNSVDPVRLQANLARLATSEARFDAAERRVIDMGLGDLSGRDDERLPSSLSELPAIEFRAVMHQAGELLGTTAAILGHDDAARAAREAIDDARIRVAAELAAGRHERARELASELSAASGFHPERLSGGSLQVAGTDHTANFKAENQRMQDQMERDLRDRENAHMSSIGEREAQLRAEQRNADLQSARELDQIAEDEATDDYRLRAQEDQLAYDMDHFNHTAHMMHPQQRDALSVSSTPASISLRPGARFSAATSRTRGGLMPGSGRPGGGTTSCASTISKTSESSSSDAFPACDGRPRTDCCATSGLTSRPSWTG